MKTKLQIAWISGIVYVIMGFPEMILDLTRGGEAYSGPFLGLYSLVYAFSIAAGILFILGFLFIAYKIQHPLLVISVYFLIIASILSYVYDIISLSYEVIEEDTIGIVESVMFGSLSIIFGIALFGLKKKLGTIARAAGILEIIVGATLFCVILFWVGLILLIPANIFEIILLYRASRMKWI